MCVLTAFLIWYILGKPEGYRSNTAFASVNGIKMPCKKTKTGQTLSVLEFTQLKCINDKTVITSLTIYIKYNCFISLYSSPHFTDTFGHCWIFG